MSRAREIHFSIRGGSVRDGSRRQLDDLELELAGGRIAVLLGPGGSGKSTLLRALCGALPGDWRREGVWRLTLGGRELHRPPEDSLFWMAQKPGEACAGSSSAPLQGEALAAALAEPRDLVLLDEPRLSATDLEPGGWVDALSAARNRGALIVVVTHDVSLAERIGDDLLLLYGGRVVARGVAPDFFSQPPNEAARQFIRQGNCCLPAVGAELPSHFRWIVPNQLAGMGRPGLLGDFDADLAAVAGAGVTHLITLTEESLSPQRLAGYGLEARHFPIPDMGVPALAAAARLCRDISRLTRGGAVVAVHCHAGLGRTGLILAAVLVWEGIAAAEAIAMVRAERKGYLQNRAQELFVERFANDFAPGRTRGEAS